MTSEQAKTLIDLLTKLVNGVERISMGEGLKDNDATGFEALVMTLSGPGAPGHRSLADAIQEASREISEALDRVETAIENVDTAIRSRG